MMRTVLPTLTLLLLITALWLATQHPHLLLQVGSL
jgi:hypothetical protein